MLPAFQYPGVWAITQLRTALDSIQYGYTAPAIPEKVGPKFLRITDLEGGPLNWSKIPHCICKNPAPYLLASGDLVIARTGATTGKSHLLRDIPEAAVFASYLIRLRCSPSLDAGFLNHFLQSSEYWRQICSQSYGTAQPGANASVLAKLVIPMPELEEQQAIARILDAVDVAIERTRMTIAAAELLRRGLAKVLLTCGVDERGRLRDPLASPDQFHVTPLGRVPVAWTISKVGTEFDLATGFTLGEHRRPKINKRRYLRVANVQRERIDLSDVLELEASDGEMEGRRLEENDLLIVEGHANPYEIGRCALVKAEAAGLTFQNHLFRLRSCGISPAFSCHWLNSEFARRYWRRKCGTSSGLNTINQRMLKSLPVIVPDEQEQKRIVAVLEAADCKIQEEYKRLKKIEKLKRGLMQDLLTGRVRVKLPTFSGNGVVRSQL